jgi:hypothetical protein
MRFDRALFQDAITIGFDGLFGIIFALLLFASVGTRWVVLLGALGALLPDAVQFLHARLPYEPLTTLQRLHRWAHSQREIKDRICWGIVSQGLIVIAVTMATMAAHNGSLLSATFAASAAAPS